MITVGMNYRVLEGKEETFEKAVSGVLKALKSTEGHLTSHLFRDVLEPQTYLITSEWESESQFQEFITSEKFRNVVSWGKEQILAGRPSHQIYKESVAVSS